MGGHVGFHRGPNGSRPGDVQLDRMQSFRWERGACRIELPAAMSAMVTRSPCSSSARAVASPNRWRRR